MASTIGYSEQTSTSTTQKPSWYDQLYQSMLQQGQQRAGVAGTPYYGALTAGFTPQQQQAGQLLQQGLGSWQPTYQQGLGTLQGALTQTQQAAQYNPSQMQQFLNPYIGGVVNEISRLGTQNLTQNVLPGIADQYTSLGQFGSSRQGEALARAASQAQREISGQQAQALAGAYGQAAQQYGNWAGMGLQAGQQAAGIGGQQLGAAQTGQQLRNLEQQQLFGYGQQQQQTQQAQLDKQYQEWLRQQQAPMQALGQWGTLFGAGTPSSTTSQTTSGTQSQFRRGGLVRGYADGGLTDNDYVPSADPADLRRALLEGLQQRRALIGKVQEEPSFQALPEPSQPMQLGQAMLAASAAGPANLGQMIGRAGTAYFGEQEKRQEENLKRAKIRQALEEQLSRTSGLGLGGGGAGGMGVESFTKMSGKDGSQWMVSNKDPSNARMVLPGNYADQIVRKATDLAKESLKNATFPDSSSRDAAIQQAVSRYRADLEKQYAGLGATPLTNAGVPGAAAVGERDFPGSNAPPLPSAQIEVPSPRPTAPSVAVTPKGDFQGRPEDIRKEIEQIRDPNEREAASKALEAQIAHSQNPANFAERPPVSGQIASEQEKETEKKAGDVLGKQYATMHETADTARTKIDRMQRLRQLLEGVHTGKLTPLGTEISGWVSALGDIPGDPLGPWVKSLGIDQNLPNKEAAQALLGQMALELRSTGEGAGMPGAMSDKDREFLIKMTPSLAMRPEGAKLLFDTYEKMAKRQIKAAELARGYKRANPRNTFDEGYFDYMNEWNKLNPVFGEKDLAPPTSTSKKRFKFNPKTGELE